MEAKVPTLLLITTIILFACGERSTQAPVAEASPVARTNVMNPAGTCNQGQAAWAVGKRSSDDFLERARLDAGAEVARFLRSGQAVTMEYNERRLNLEVDAGHIVTTVRCG